MKKKRLTKKEVRIKANKTKAKKYANDLRRRATKHERILREALDHFGIKHYFQKPFYCDKKCYIADFYFSRKGYKGFMDKGLIVEVDGDTHRSAKAKAYDAERNKYFRSRRIHTVRFTNEEVFNDVEGVIKRIFPLLSHVDFVGQSES